MQGGWTCATWVVRWLCVCEGGKRRLEMFAWWGEGWLNICEVGREAAGYVCEAGRGMSEHLRGGVRGGWICPRICEGWQDNGVGLVGLSLSGCSQFRDGLPGGLGTSVWNPQLLMVAGLLAVMKRW